MSWVLVRICMSTSGRGAACERLVRPSCREWRRRRSPGALMIIDQGHCEASRQGRGPGLVASGGASDAERFVLADATVLVDGVFHLIRHFVYHGLVFAVEVRGDVVILTHVGRI